MLSVRDTGLAANVLTLSSRKLPVLVFAGFPSSRVNRLANWQTQAERAFLGMLQRWYQQDAESEKLTAPSVHPDFTTLTEQQHDKSHRCVNYENALDRTSTSPKG
jgi:hypothetical protein